MDTMTVQNAVGQGLYLIFDSKFVTKDSILML